MLKKLANFEQNSSILDFENPLDVVAVNVLASLRIFDRNLVFYHSQSKG